jgi:hypothetical protein
LLVIFQAPLILRRLWKSIQPADLSAGLSKLTCALAASPTWACPPQKQLFVARAGAVSFSP